MEKENTEVLSKSMCPGLAERNQDGGRVVPPCCSVLWYIVQGDQGWRCLSNQGQYKILMKSSNIPLFFGSDA